MLESNLYELYNYSKDFSHKSLSIQLYSKPIHAEITSAFLVPFLTREEVESKPELQHSFRNMHTNLATLEEKKGRKIGFIEKARSLLKDVGKLGQNQLVKNDGVCKCTIVVQATIYCKEFFSVRDVHSGLIIQGNENGMIQDVNHLVRFERVGCLSTASSNDEGRQYHRKKTTEDSNKTQN